MPGIADLVEAAHGGGLLAQVELRHAIQLSLGGGNAGRDEIRGFLRSANPRAWVAIMRALCYGEERVPKKPWWSKAWRALLPPGPGDSDAAVQGMASMDREGRVREVAVRQLRSRDGPFSRVRSWH